MSIQWLLASAAVIHVYEEYATGFIGWTRVYARRMHLTRLGRLDMKSFLVVNGLFLALTLAAALAGGRAPVLGLSVAALVFINAWFHILPAAIFRRYVPGLASAALLYLPLSLWTFHLNSATGVGTGSVVAAWCLGLLWMSFPLLYQLIPSIRG